MGATEGPTARPGCPFPGLAPVPGVLPASQTAPLRHVRLLVPGGFPARGAWREAAREARAGAGQSPPDPAGLHRPGDGVTPPAWEGLALGGAEPEKAQRGAGISGREKTAGWTFPKPSRAGGRLAGGVVGWGADAGAPRSPWQVSAKASLACLEGCGWYPRY